MQTTTSNRLFIVEQAGVIKVLQPGATEPTTFLDIRTRILAGGERGLLGLAFHPQYAEQRPVLRLLHARRRRRTGHRRIRGLAAELGFGADPRKKS